MISLLRRKRVSNTEVHRRLLDREELPGNVSWTEFAEAYCTPTGLDFGDVSHLELLEALLAHPDLSAEERDWIVGEALDAEDRQGRGLVHMDEENLQTILAAPLLGTKVKLETLERAWKRPVVAYQGSPIVASRELKERIVELLHGAAAHSGIREARIMANILTRAQGFHSLGKVTRIVLEQLTSCTDEQLEILYRLLEDWGGYRKLSEIEELHEAARLL